MPQNTPKEKHDHGPLKFPEGFLWGSATSAHQVEGNNINSDWWEWEMTHQPKEKRSGNACDQYNKFEEDFNLIKDLNQNAHRLSIEWARIEPEQGEFKEEEIEHYKNVLKALKKRNIKVMLTLWHFTLPNWVAKNGGWENPKTISLFLRFIKKVVPEIKNEVDFWITLNEPTVYVYMSYYLGTWPPQKKSKLASTISSWNLAQAHKKAYELIHKLDSGAKVGIAHNVQSFASYHKHSILEQIAVAISDGFINHLFYFLTRGSHDFLGVNYYFHHRFKQFENLYTDVIGGKNAYRNVSDLGWEVYPEGIYDVLSDLVDHVPIYITECGIASTNDDRRTRFLLNYLSEIYRAIKTGIPVKGFYYWSLVDNFEWHQGFDPRFGLIEVDFKTQKRQIRPSAYVYSKIAKDNAIDHSLLRLLGHTVTVSEVLCYLHDGPKVLCEHLTNSRYPKFSNEVKLQRHP